MRMELLVSRIGNRQRRRSDPGVMTVEIIDPAKDDLADGFEFYEGQRRGLGDYFLDSLFADIDSLILYAGVHRVEFGYHRALARTFPYFIYYDVIGDQIRIIAVLDQRSDPTFRWQQTTGRA